MRSSNLTRLDRLEFQRGTVDLLHGQGIKIDGMWEVEGFGNDEITGIYNDDEYMALVARKDVMIITLVVRDPVE